MIRILCKYSEDHNGHLCSLVDYRYCELTLFLDRNHLLKPVSSFMSDLISKVLKLGFCL